jgi:hypothetical protein
MFTYLALKIRERLYAGEFTFLCGKIESEEISVRCCQLFVTFAYIHFFVEIKNNTFFVLFRLFGHRFLPL